ncbi:MAG: hypothetical protein P8101_00815, partial [Candidatus Thiodiazotropha sp.]
ELLQMPSSFPLVPLLVAQRHGFEIGNTSVSANDIPVPPLIEHSIICCIDTQLKYLITINYSALTGRNGGTGSED